VSLKKETSKEISEKGDTKENKEKNRNFKRGESTQGTSALSLPESIE
jgi:hypothetical protein